MTQSQTSSAMQPTGEGGQPYANDQSGTIGGRLAGYTDRLQMLDQTGYPIHLDDVVEITNPQHLREPIRNLLGQRGKVVGLDTIDWRTGVPRGDQLIYLRIDGDDAVIHIHPARVRVRTKTK